MSDKEETRGEPGGQRLGPAAQEEPPVYFAILLSLPTAGCTIGVCTTGRPGWGAGRGWCGTMPACSATERRMSSASPPSNTTPLLHVVCSVYQIYGRDIQDFVETFMKLLYYVHMNALFMLDQQERTRRKKYLFW